MPSPSRPLIVRLRNWVGDVTLGVPTLQRLADHGYALQLVGKGWARDLLAGQGFDRRFLEGPDCPRRIAAADDFLDACATAWTANRLATGRAERLPADPATDPRGLRMEIVF